MSNRTLADFSGRDVADGSGRDVVDFSGRGLANFSGRDERAIGSQLFPWVFPLWFSDVEPRNISDIE